MTDFNQPAARIDRPLANRTAIVTAGPLFDSKDIAAFVVLVIMNLLPLAMAAFWAPYH
jgi:hypothetical protein